MEPNRFLKWIDRLQAHPNCTGYAHDLISVVIEGMLVIDPEKRITVEELYKVLSDMKDECARDNTYLHTGGPGRDILRSRFAPGTFKPGMPSGKRPRSPTPEALMSHATTAIGRPLSDSSPPATGLVKRQKTTIPETITTAYACPFRKRNPIRFNVRAYQTCALSSFPDIPQVKYA